MTYLLSYVNWKKLYEAANGELAPASLEKIPVISGDSTNHKLNPTAAAKYLEMVEAAKRDGIEWGITDSYRPLEVQKKLAIEKGLYSKGGLAASPGTSNHGWGSAVDLKVKDGDPAHDWLVNNASRFGFSTIPREPWHWEHKESAKAISQEPDNFSAEKTATSAGSKTTFKLFFRKLFRRVLAKYDIAIGGYQIYNKSGDEVLGKIVKKDNKIYFVDTDTKGFDITETHDGELFQKAFEISSQEDIGGIQSVLNGKLLLRSGSTGEEVKIIQQKLKEAGYNINATGVFDENTKAIVKDYQNKNGLSVDGIVGPITSGTLYGMDVSRLKNNIEVMSGKIKHGYSGPAAANIDLLIKEMISAGITNPAAQVGMLSVIGKESGFIPKDENMNYSKERLPEVWGAFSKTGAMVPKGQGASNYNNLAVEYEHNPEKLSNFVYGVKPYGRLDAKNAGGNTDAGDGWKYRGRGFNGITFKGGYKKYGALIGKDLVSNPDLLNDPKVAAQAAVKYFMTILKSKNIDPNSFKSADEAMKIFARANAGWGSSQSVQDFATTAAAKVMPNFSVQQDGIA